MPSPDSPRPPDLPSRRPASWPRDWITWVACLWGVGSVTAYVALLLISRFDLLALLAGAAVGISLAPVLGARRSLSATCAIPVVFVFSCTHPAWVLLLSGAVLLQKSQLFLGFLFKSSDMSIMLAVTAVAYSVIVGLAAQSWKVALAILACGAASIMVDYAFPRQGFAPSIAILCLGVVIVPAIDTLARASITFAAHSCPHCGYDLRGLHDSAAVCPECGGSTIAPSKPHH